MGECDGSDIGAISNRVEWIDTAKGICILLVVLYHCALLARSSYPCSRVAQTFRMPLYFILSGIFFKKYEGFIGFLKRKTNKLLIPYVFFFIVTGVLIPVTVSKLFGYSMASYNGYGFGMCRYVFSEIGIVNAAIWFLFCLFEVNVLFYLLFVVSERFRSSHVVLGITMGVIGLSFSLRHVNVPYFVDSAFSAMPFFYFGWLLKNHTAFFSWEKSKKSVIFSLVFIAVVFVVIHEFNYGLMDMVGNNYGGLWGCVQAYPYGILGTLAVLSASRIVGKVPVLSYIGRYSIIVLCTHVYAMYFADRVVVGRIVTSPGLRLALDFVITVVICLGLIPVLKKYLGYFTAQKDLIRIGDNVK